MSCYVIGIGGTGAKCVEALTHLCAAGMLPRENLYCLFVDPDRSNGSLGRAKITLGQYQDCSELQLGDKTEVFGTKTSIGDPHVWSPFTGKQQPNLGDFFEYATLEGRVDKSAQLFDVLFSDNEKKTGLEMGFRGHPSIGAAIMARTVSLSKTEPWKTFRNKVSADTTAGQQAKIFMFGSIFGGTGASGFPTIARLIRNELRLHEVELVKIGGVLLLPYFSFVPPSEKKELRAVSENFLMNTQMALQYYQSRQKQHDIIYLLGEANPTSVQYCLGASEQKNDPHFLELYAALAAIHFFTGKELKKGYAMIARQESDYVKWLDLPDEKNGNELKKHLIHLARFAFAYLSVFFKTWEAVRKSGGAYRAPWYIDYFVKDGGRLERAAVEAKLDQVKHYCESYLLWLANLAASVGTKTTVQFVNYAAFAESKKHGDRNVIQLRPQFLEKEFGNLALPEEKERPNDLAKVWERMSEGKIDARGAIGLGKFFNALYKVCAE